MARSSTTRSAWRAASGLATPRTSASSPASARSSAAAACAFSTWREPINTLYPALNQRYARPCPSFPVPPIIPIVRMPAVCSLTKPHFFILLMLNAFLLNSCPRRHTGFIQVSSSPACLFRVALPDLGSPLARFRRNFRLIEPQQLAVAHQHHPSRYGRCDHTLMETKHNMPG